MSLSFRRFTGRATVVSLVISLLLCGELIGQDPPPLQEGWPITLDIGGWKQITLADVDSDGLAEVIVCRGSPSGGGIHVLKGNGTVAPGWPFTFGQGIQGLSVGPAFGDIDGDGNGEIVYSGSDRIYALTST